MNSCELTPFLTANLIYNHVWQKRKKDDIFNYFDYIENFLFQASIGKKKVHFAKTNMDKSIEKCNQIIKRFQAPKMSRKINKREYDCEGGSNEFEKDLIEVEKEYYKQTIKNNLTLAVCMKYCYFHLQVIILLTPTNCLILVLDPIFRISFIISYHYT